MINRAFLALLLHDRQCRRATSSTITAFAARRDALVGTR
jgi:hypothetical protein